MRLLSQQGDSGLEFFRIAGENDCGRWGIGAEEWLTGVSPNIHPRVPRVFKRLIRCHHLLSSLSRMQIGLFATTSSKTKHKSGKPSTSCYLASRNAPSPSPALRSLAFIMPFVNNNCLPSFRAWGLSDCASPRNRILQEWTWKSLFFRSTPQGSSGPLREKPVTKRAVRPKLSLISLIPSVTTINLAYHYSRSIPHTRSRIQTR